MLINRIYFCAFTNSNVLALCIISNRYYYCLAHTIIYIINRLYIAILT